MFNINLVLKVKSFISRFVEFDENHDNKREYLGYCVHMMEVLNKLDGNSMSIVNYYVGMEQLDELTKIHKNKKRLHPGMLTSNVVQGIQSLTRSFEVISFVKNIELMNGLEETERNSILNNMDYFQLRYYEYLVNSKCYTFISEESLDEIKDLSLDIYIEEALRDYKKNLTKLVNYMDTNNMSVDELKHDMMLENNGIALDLFNCLELNNFQTMNVNHLQDMQIRDFTISESLKSITPTDFGGHVGGIGFNPSETMHFESVNQHNNMF